MKKTFFLLLGVALIFCSCKKEDIVSQKESCPTGGPKRLTTQDEVDAFGALGCTDLAGSLFIDDISSSQKINSLAPLASLTRVGSVLGIRTKELKNLDGLSNLTAVGYLRLIDNTDLEDLSALSGLVELSGPVEDPCSCALTQNRIENNGSLQSLAGLSNLKTISSGLFIKGNPVLKNVNGLDNLATIKGALAIEDNPKLENLNSLSKLTAVKRDLVFRRNHALKDFSGLDNLKSVEIDLIVQEHNILENLDALRNLTLVRGSIAINDNPALSSCCGLYSVLCSDPPECSRDNVTHSVLLTGNPGGCTIADILDNGPCTQ